MKQNLSIHIDVLSTCYYKKLTMHSTVAIRKLSHDLSIALRCVALHCTAMHCVLWDRSTRNAQKKYHKYLGQAYFPMSVDLGRQLKRFARNVLTVRVF